MPPETVAQLGRLAPDTYTFSYENHTALFIVTDEGVIVADPCGQANPRVPFILKETIRSLTEQPVKYVLYSHWGADHGMGGAVFADTARFVSHRNAAPKIAAANDPTSPVPDLLFDDRLTLELGGKKVELYAAELSPKDDYFLLHYPAGKVIMAVDYVQPLNVPFRGMVGHPDWTVRRLEWIDNTLDFDTVVSGHSTPQVTGSRKDVGEARGYLLDLSDAVAAAQAKGLADNSPEMVDAVREAMTPKYGKWRRFDQFLPLNVEGLLRWRAETP
jgi:glyoxylase-like metal-dependent hydrolase (beta-lactamase superfamily II)